MNVEIAIRQLRTADTVLKRALTQHRLAPPDDGYGRRLGEFADACEQEQTASESAASVGLTFTPASEAEAPIRLPVPHELSPNSGRRGPDELWEEFDRAVDDVNRAFEGISFATIGRAFGELSLVARQLAQAESERDREARAAQPGPR